MGREAGGEKEQEQPVNTNFEDFVSSHNQTRDFFFFFPRIRAVVIQASRTKKPQISICVGNNNTAAR
jgi:hypothetical protein